MNTQQQNEQSELEVFSSPYPASRGFLVALCFGGRIKPRLPERFFACDGDAIFFLKIVASPARGENRMCSHPRTGDATDEKIAEKNREKFNELNFLRENHELRQRVATQAIFAARWRRDNFKKIASPSQAKNRSCSLGLSNLFAKPSDSLICRRPRFWTN